MDGWMIWYGMVWYALGRVGFFGNSFSGFGVGSCYLVLDLGTRHHGAFRDLSVYTRHGAPIEFACHVLSENANYRHPPWPTKSWLPNLTLFLPPQPSAASVSPFRIAIHTSWPLTTLLLTMPLDPASKIFQPKRFPSHPIRKARYNRSIEMLMFKLQKKREPRSLDTSTEGTKN